jgi:pimeloyl-ACP methyl ester carboxylesterase
MTFPERPALRHRGAICFSRWRVEHGFQESCPVNELLLRERIALQKNEFAPGRDTLVFIHGLAGSSSAWADYVLPFDRDFNLVFPDLRGHGKSRRYRDFSDYRLSLFSKDLEAMFSDLEISEPTLIAHSFGALVAMDYIMRHTRKIRKAVFISARFNPGNRLFFHLASLVDSMLTPVYPLLPPPGFRRLDYKNFPRQTDFDPQRLHHDIVNTGFPVFVHCSRQILSSDYEKAAAEMDFPVLLIHGDRDRVFSVRQALENRRKLRNTRLEIVPGANHVVVLTHAQWLCEKIRNFVDE